MSEGLTFYDPRQERYFVVSQGIGGPDGPWGLFEQKKNGTLRRVTQVPMILYQEQANETALNYARWHGWVTVGMAEVEGGEKGA